MKTRGTMNPISRKVTWHPGRVHSIPTHADSVSKYRFFKVDVSPDGANAALNFLQSQLDAPFNFAGYVLNFVLPVKIGVRNHQHAMRKKTNKWFCSELVVCACQAAGVREMQLLTASAVSPNELYSFVLKRELGQPIEFEAYQAYKI